MRKTRCFRRLRQNQSPEVQSSLSQLDRLEDEHRWAAPLHADVELLGARYLLAGGLSAAEVERFRNAVASLATLYKRHITVEDSVIFPLAARLLTQTEKMEIAEEMTRRRGAEAVPKIDF